MSFSIGNVVQKNKIIIVIILILLSISSIYIPHQVGELHEHHEFEMMLRQIIVNNKISTYVKKILERIQKILGNVLTQIISEAAQLHLKNLFSFFKLIMEVPLLQLLYFLCSYFNGGKFKQTHTIQVC